MDRAASRSFPRYLIWRLVVAMVVVVLALTLIFYAIEVQMPDPTRFLLPRGGCGGASNGSCALRDQFIRLWGLDKPLLDRYVIFLSNVFTGNLGPSLTTNPGTPVASILATALPTTLVLVGIGLLAVVLVGLLLGLPLARRRGGLGDNLVSFLLALPFAIPAIVFALGMVALFAVANPVFPPYGTASPDHATLDPAGQFLDTAWHFVLPLIVLILSACALWVWVVRDHPLRPPEPMASGAPGEWRAREPDWGDRLRGALPRFLPGIPALLGWTITSALVVDAVFGLNGLGTLMWRATLNLDYGLLLGVVLVVSLVLVLPALVVADLLHYAATKDWTRADRLSVERFRVEPRDLPRGFRRILLHPLGFVGLVLGLVLVAMTAAAPLLVGPIPTVPGIAQPLLPPSPEHPLGTDSLGLDILALTLYGGETGLLVALAAFAFAIIAELGVAAVIGLFGDRADVFLGIPGDLLLVLPLPFVLLVGVTGSRISFVLFAALVAWPIPARFLRMELSGLVGAERGSTKATWTQRGRRTLDLIWGMGPVLLGDALLAVSFALSIWSVMGFMGFRVPGTDSWGEQISDWYYSLGFLQARWDEFLAPMLCLLGAVLAPTLLSLACKSIPPVPRRAAAQPASSLLLPEVAPTTPPP